MLNSLGITPSHRGHVGLEKRVETFLKANGFVIETSTYHDTYSKEVVGLLSRRNTPTALAIRGRADKVAVHKTLPIEFEYDAKTHVSTQYHDLTVEAMPLAHHVLGSHLGKKTLYIFVDASGQDRSFWARFGLPIREIHIPNRWNAEQTAMYQHYLAATFPGVHIRTNTKSTGSGDPFAIIDRSVVSRMTNWQDVITRLIAKGS